MFASNRGVPYEKAGEAKLGSSGDGGHMWRRIGGQRRQSMLDASAGGIVRVLRERLNQFVQIVRQIAFRRAHG